MVEQSRTIYKKVVGVVRSLTNHDECIKSEYYIITLLLFNKERNGTDSGLIMVAQAA